jgi:soluble lytic murein transglycosylase-like protein
MKSPSNIVSCLSMHGYDRQNIPRKDFNTEKNSDLFIKLLEDNAKNIEDPEKPNRSVLPINQKYLQQLINAVKGQMNDYLFQELLKFDEDSDLSEFNCQWMSAQETKNPGPSIVSKTSHDPHKGKEIKSSPEINEIIEHASKTYEIDPLLIKSVIRVESDFDANATSPKGAMGLMQLMPKTAKDLGVKNCYNPVENIMAGTRYLKSLLDRYDGNIELTLAAYNWGMGNLERHPDKLPMETRTYIARVNGYIRMGTT